LEAQKIADTAAKYNMPCMLGGMVESRLALTAKVHLAMAHNNLQLGQDDFLPFLRAYMEW